MITSNDRIVEQRRRNRIIEYLELAASTDSQLAYQAAVPYINVSNEIINQWEDCIQDFDLSNTNRRG